MLVAVVALAGMAQAGVGDPQTKTDHPWYPGELSCSTWERLFKTQAELYERVTGKKVASDEDKALASWYWRNLNVHHCTTANEDFWGKGIEKGEETREYWAGLFAYGFGLCYATHHQMTAEMEKLLGPCRSRATNVAGHTSFEVWLTGGPYGAGQWALLDHDISTVVFTPDGSRLMGLMEISKDMTSIKKSNRERGFIPGGLHPSDPGVYKTVNWVGYTTGYAGPPPLVNLRAGESLRRYLKPGLDDGNVRGNRLENNAHIAIGGTDPNNPALRHPLVQDVIVEKNHVANADIGIHVRRAAEGVLVRENTFENVVDPEITDDEIERRAAERRAKLLGLKEPVARWSFDKVSGTKVPDDSGHDFAGRAVGGVRFGPGVRGNAAIFDGKSHIHVANGDLLAPTRFTLAAWIKPTAVAGRQGIIAKRTGHAAAPFVLSVWNGALEFEACEADHRTWSFNFRSEPLLKAGEWQHVAAVVEEGKGVTLYLNGKAIARKENAAKLAQNDLDIWIGKEAWGADPKDAAIPGYFTGSIDEVKLWTRALGEVEMDKEAELKGLR